MWTAVRLALVLTFRCLLASDINWLTENANDPEAAKYAISIYPIAEHEVGEFLMKASWTFLKLPNRGLLIFFGTFAQSQILL